MSLPRPMPSKKDVALRLMETADVFVHLDPRPTTVAVPPHLKHAPHLILQVGLNMAVRIPDLQVDDEGISCTLSFSRSPFWCKVPWEAVYALVSHDRRGMVWNDDVPADAGVDFLGKGPIHQVSPPQASVNVHPASAPRAVAALAAQSAGPPDGAQPSRAKKGKRRQIVAAPRAVAPQDFLSVSPPIEPSPSTPSPPSAPAQDPAKPKRQLPSYLRVVK